MSSEQRSGYISWQLLSSDVMCLLKTIFRYDTSEKLLFLINIKFTSHTTLLLESMETTQSHRFYVVTIF